MANPRLAISSKVRPNIREVTKEILAAFPEVTQIWTWADFPDHNNGRCTDFMSYNDRALGERIAAYILKHQDRLGVVYIVWWERIYRRLGNANGPARTWTPYRGPNPHRDHVHIEVDDRTYTPPPTLEGELTVAQIDDLIKEIRGLREDLNDLPKRVWSADVIPDAGWVNDPKNKTVQAGNAAKFIGADIKAVRQALKTLSADVKQWQAQQNQQP